jgi:hypothetical protein
MPLVLWSRIEVLMEPAAMEDSQQLHSTTNTQHRLVAFQRTFEQVNLRGVLLWVEFASVRVWILTMGRWIQIRTPSDDEAVDAV